LRCYRSSDIHIPARVRLHPTPITGVFFFSATCSVENRIRTVVYLNNCAHVACSPDVGASCTFVYSVVVGVRGSCVAYEFGGERRTRKNYRFTSKRSRVYSSCTSQTNPVKYIRLRAWCRIRRTNSLFRGRKPTHA